MSLATGRVPGAEPAAPARMGARTRLPWYTFLKNDWPLYAMALPGVLAILVFGYGPLFGLVVAFQDFDPVLGIFKSDWVGWDNFRDAFASPFFWAALRNSITISALKLAVGFPSAIMLALLLNEVRIKWFKRVVQTSTILPFFLSWVVAAAMFQDLFAPDGVINGIRQHVFGLQQVVFLSDPIKFLWIIVFQDTWKYVGYFAVLYLSAIATIDPALYEVAMVDGASRWQQTWHVTLPGMRTTMITLFVLLTGYLISAGFEQIYVMYNVSVYPTADILETFTLRLGLSQGNYGLATAVGMFQSLISLVLVLATNLLVKRFNQEGLF